MFLNTGNCVTPLGTMQSTKDGDIYIGGKKLLGYVAWRKDRGKFVTTVQVYFPKGMTVKAKTQNVAKTQHGIQPWYTATEKIVEHIHTTKKQGAMEQNE